MDAECVRKSAPTSRYSGREGRETLRRDVSTGTYFTLGDVACAEGALAAGCRFFAGYPITPATEIAEHMSRRLPESWRRLPANGRRDRLDGGGDRRVVSRRQVDDCHIGPRLQPDAGEHWTRSHDRDAMRCSGRDACRTEHRSTHQDRPTGCHAGKVGISWRL